VEDIQGRLRGSVIVDQIFKFHHFPDHELCELLRPGGQSEWTRSAGEPGFGSLVPGSIRVPRRDWDSRGFLKLQRLARHNLLDVLPLRMGQVQPLDQVLKPSLRF
jgi:hypothetical protein